MRLSLGALILSVLTLILPALAADRYPDVAALRAHEKEGVDFRVETLDRSSPVTVFAIHGGSIEPGTSAVARRLAGDDWNLYLFEGLGRSARSLHVTSAHFDDPAAVALAARSAVAVSVHGEKGSAPLACVGGADAGLAREVADALRAAGFQARQPCRRFPATDPRNIVNRAKSGVQLELTRPLRDLLVRDASRLERFTRAVRGALAARR